jgi:16S rRNA (cytosine1402-N4)-methyltransferase
MAEACIDGLAIRPDGTYVDGTFGRGGHSARILASLGPGGRLLAIDRDPEAVAAGRGWADGRFGIVHARFSEIGEVLDARGIGGVDGVLLDLGVSSPQLDDASRGFSFRSEGRSTCGWTRRGACRRGNGCGRRRNTTSRRH